MRVVLSLIFALVTASTFAQKADREIWVNAMYKMSQPLLEPMSEGKLKKTMQVELAPTWDGRSQDVTYMEGFGRLMAGLAPWLALPEDNSEEGKKRKQLKSWALKSYVHAVDPQSPDYLLWRKEGQPLVDAAFLAQSFIRAYDVLWLPLDELTKKRYIEEFTQLRRVDPPHSNWLLFSAMVETFLKKAGAPHDNYRITSALIQINKWYVGDSWYSDGDHFAFDYYNSFVIQPMYYEILAELTENGSKDTWRFSKNNFVKAEKRMQRHAIILERFISPEGTFPVFGRSITYRTAVFQPLSLLVWKQKLPKDLSHGQVRSALTLVIKNMFEDNRNFNSKGFLVLGFNGSQANISDVYTNNGSLYLASLAFMPLGLPENHAFWTEKSEDWTSKKAWAGQDFPKDKAFNDN